MIRSRLARNFIRGPDENGLTRMVCGECGNFFLVDYEEWLLESEYNTRPCPFCFKTSRLPGCLIYDGSETLRATEQQVVALESVLMIRYSPEDGPNGIVWRPMPEVSMERIKAVLQY